MGGVTAPQKILHLHPADGVVNDGGWGYVGALGSIAKIRGRRWFPILGYSQLMPESLMDWLLAEAADDFERGDVFIAPAELIGVDPAAPDSGIHALEAVVGGRRAQATAETAATFMQIEIPYLDEMSRSAFRRFLRHHENELVRFRQAFKRLVAGVPERDLTAVIDELKEEVAARPNQSDMPRSGRLPRGSVAAWLRPLLPWPPPPPSVPN